MFLFYLIAIAYSLQENENDVVDIDALNQLFKTEYTGQLYSGYLSANIDQSAQFHYMFYPALQDPDNKPIILWLNGGPGCSSLQGAFNENGPFVFKAGTAQFVNNPYSWTNIASLLYIESPITVGYSYGPDGEQTDESTATYNLQALLSFFIKFPQYLTNEFFIAGESYAGIYIPTLASHIIDYNANPTNTKVPKIRLQGLAIGNGCTDPTECTDDADPFPIHQFKFYGRHDFITQELYEKILVVQDECYGKYDGLCQELANQVDQEINNGSDEILYNPYNIYGYCFMQTPEGSKRSKKTRGLYKTLGDDTDVPPCADVVGLYYYLRKTEVRQLLNINEKSADWVVCSTKISYQSDPRGSYYLYKKLIKNDIRILKFSGDVDAIVPITGTLYWINKLQNELFLPALKPWRPWFVEPQREVDPEQNAGNVIDLDGLTFLTIRNAGHMVPLEKRPEALLFMEKFLQNESFP